MITLDELKHSLNYDPETGFFWWKSSGSGRNLTKPAGAIDMTGYVHIGFKDMLSGKVRRYKAHRLAFLYVHGRWPVEMDHINGNRSDNRIANLREVTHVQNMQNREKLPTNTSGFKGVNRHEGRWVARILVNKKRVHLGRFDTPEEAYQAYLQAAHKFHGQFSSELR